MEMSQTLPGGRWGIYLFCPHVYNQAKTSLYQESLLSLQAHLSFLTTGISFAFIFCMVPRPAFLPPGRYFVHVEWPLSLWIGRLFLKREKRVTHCHLTSCGATLITYHKTECASVLLGAACV
uniref:Uncharacterized protein n=1 Tax=Pipistrellus kuhlii TaxID=59472 RepID=A0A7J7XB17_PIPKU|nr:hypothetical protein mPipKuh1_010628 [Pipistrellus kuhlii]